MEFETLNEYLNYIHANKNNSNSPIENRLEETNPKIFEDFSIEVAPGKNNLEEAISFYYIQQGYKTLGKTSLGMQAFEKDKSRVAVTATQLIDNQRVFRVTVQKWEYGSTE